MNKNLTVEKILVKALKELKNFSLEKGYPVMCWNFNSKFGNSAIYQNSPIKIKRNKILTSEQRSMYHAERNCANKLTQQEKEQGQNTLFVTLIPCPNCLKFLSNNFENYHVIYFVDHLNKASRQSYKEWNKRIPMTRYKTYDSDVLKVIDEIKEIYIKREERINGSLDLK